MKTIIKMGTKQARYCDVCGCYFSYGEEDIETKSEYDSRITSSSKYIECPQCGYKIYILQSKEVPEETKQHISNEMAKLQGEIMNQEAIAKAIKEMPKSTWFEEMVKEKKYASEEV